MSRRVERVTPAGRRKKSRMSLLWVAVAVVVVIVLLAQEQIALLYVLATLGVTALLLVVAFSDLHGARQEAVQVAPADDSAAIADRTAKQSPATTFGSTRPRPIKNRRTP